jgi:hypothetical protein
MSVLFALVRCFSKYEYVIMRDFSLSIVLLIVVFTESVFFFCSFVCQRVFFQLLVMFYLAS